MAVDGRTVAQRIAWLIAHVLIPECKRRGIALEDCPVTPKIIAEIAIRIRD